MSDEEVKQVMIQSLSALFNTWKEAGCDDKSKSHAQNFDEFVLQLRDACNMFLDGEV